jgi:hypothetical protein
MCLHDYEMQVCPIIIVTLEAAERVVGGGEKGAEPWRLDPSWSLNGAVCRSR